MSGVAAAVAASALLALLPPADSAAGSVREAAALIEQGRVEDARRSLETLVEAGGERRFAAWALLGRTWLLLGDPEAAAEAFEQALAGAPGFVPARLGRAEAWLALGRLEPAIAELERLGVGSAPSPRALELLAGARLARDDRPGARELWERLGDWPAFERSARLLLSATAGDRASLLREADRDLGAPAVYLALGVERIGAGDRAAGLELLRVAREVTAHEPIAGLLLGQLEGEPVPAPAHVERLEQRSIEAFRAWEEGRLDDADREARSLLASRPRHVPMAVLVARIAEARGDVWRALEGYEGLLEVVGPLPSLSAGAARAALAAGAIALAECRARETLALRPEDTASTRLLAAARARAGARDEAVALLEELVRLDPADVSSWLALGDLMFDAMRPETAIEAYRRALEVDSSVAERVPAFALIALASSASAGAVEPGTDTRRLLAAEDRDALYAVAVARLRAGDLDAAERLLRDLEAAAPDSSRVAYNLAQLHRRRGRLGEARTEMERFERLKAAEAADWERHNQAHFRRLEAAELAATGRTDDALALYQQSVEAGTASTEDFLAVARLLLGDDRLDAARAWVARVLEVAPHDRVALELLAAIERRAGAVAELERLRWKLAVLDRTCGP